MTRQQEKIVVTLASKEEDDHHLDDINQIKRKEIEQGLDFILSHLEEPIIFPRTIMTKKLGYQKIVYSKERALEHFIESDFIDCRINAFPLLKEGATWMPELLFIDLDLSDFNSKRSLQIVLNNTLKSIEEKLVDNNVHPTVLWSGNGYHIILPVYCPGELERIQQFQGFTTTSKPSEEFLRFAKDYLSNGKADKSNYPSFRSCLLRIPNSLNGKCLARGEGLENSIVKIIQEWNGYRPPVVELLYDFRSYLIQKKIDDYNYKQKLLVADKKRNKKHRDYYPNKNHNNTYYQWIETILQTPFEDCRKIISSLILAPYLINVKKLPFQACFQIIKEWLDKCDSLEKLYDSGGFNSRVSYSLKNAENKQIGPMSQHKIKTDSNYTKLYILLKEKGILK
jgi:non-catalytic primase subunit PriX-like protein